MGHLGHLKDEYRDLLKRLDAGPVALPEPTEARARAARQEILEILYTPEEAALAARMPVKPAGLGRLAARLHVDREALRLRLDAMADKGLVMDIVHPDTGKTRYMLSPPVVGFFEFSLMRARDSIPKRRMAEALDAYCYGDEAFAQEVFGHETVIGRTVVHEDALGDGSDADPGAHADADPGAHADADPDLPDVLEWERASALIEGARSLAVSLCYCRHKSEHMDRPCEGPTEVCLSLNAGADFVIRRGFGEQIEHSRALDILVESRERGSVHIADNVQRRPAWICNCCACCCEQLGSINEYDLPAVNPSGWWAVTDLLRCAGCSRCSRACPITAIRMDPERVPGQLKNRMSPRIDHDRCIGCGVCVRACKKGAMEMVRRPEGPRVPENALERVIRMALERGRLPHLLFDEGASRGSRFLNRAVKTICSLPRAERLLASEQVRSRFVRFALRNIADPTGG